MSYAEENPTPLLVDIVDVMPDAVQDRADAITPGAYLFDAGGGRHKVKAVRPLKKNRVKVTREDGWYDTWKNDEPITFVRASE